MLIHTSKTEVICSYRVRREISRQQLNSTFGVASLNNMSQERSLTLSLPLFSSPASTPWWKRKPALAHWRGLWEVGTPCGGKRLWPTFFFHRQPAHIGLQQREGAHFNFKSSLVFSVSYGNKCFEILNWKCLDTGQTMFPITQLGTEKLLKWLAFSSTCEREKSSYERLREQWETDIKLFPDDVLIFKNNITREQQEKRLVKKAAKARLIHMRIWGFTIKAIDSHWRVLDRGNLWSNLYC